MGAVVRQRDSRSAEWRVDMVARWGGGRVVGGEVGGVAG